MLVITNLVNVCGFDAGEICQLQPRIEEMKVLCRGRIWVSIHNGELSWELDSEERVEACRGDVEDWNAGCKGRLRQILPS